MVAILAYILPAAEHARSTPAEEAGAGRLLPDHLGQRRTHHLLLVPPHQHTILLHWGVKLPTTHPPAYGCQALMWNYGARGWHSPYLKVDLCVSQQVLQLWVERPPRERRKLCLERPFDAPNPQIICCVAKLWAVPCRAREYYMSENIFRARGLGDQKNTNPLPGRGCTDWHGAHLASIPVGTYGR